MGRVFDRKIEIDTLPQVGDKAVNGETLFVQAVGVRIKQQRITGEYFLDMDKRYFIAKDGKGNLVNCKIVGSYL